MQLFYLSRIMGTTVAQIDATYGHLVPDSEEYLLGLLDDYDVRFPLSYVPTPESGITAIGSD